MERREKVALLHLLYFVRAQRWRPLLRLAPLLLAPRGFFQGSALEAAPIRSWQ